MDRWLHEAALRGDVPAFLDLVQEDENIVGQRIGGSSNTVLHLAAKFGHLELASEIVKLSPAMVSKENERMETPLHEACREGHVDIVKLLMEDEPWVDIVKEILKARPDFMGKRDLQECSPLHLACKKGHLEITRELLRLDPDLSSLQDNDGRTPLHWAAMKGHVCILDEILSTSLESVEMLTKQGETVLHLAVKNNRYNAIKYLVETLNITELINMPDKNGNTILHLATAGKFTTLHEAVLRGDVPAFLTLVREDENIVGQPVGGSSSSVLHLAAKFGHLELASETVKLSPAMV
ncbi:hypothetical protein HHK36_025622 [Tetracentron sinense]|uniref:Uncharacterized protein n=1 Tax=Tetracentron sinense TaxID=13715 RepID=A0A835D6K4_TETSI|nr:hypothetical protein HHK36_025622 [Tetracentron sinense]